MEELFDKYEALSALGLTEEADALVPSIVPEDRDFIIESLLKSKWKKCEELIALGQNATACELLNELTPKTPAKELLKLQLLLKLGLKKEALYFSKEIRNSSEKVSLFLQFGSAEIARQIAEEIETARAEFARHLEAGSLPEALKWADKVPDDFYKFHKLFSNGYRQQAVDVTKTIYQQMDI